MIKKIFFDFDGTISDARDIARDSLEKTLDEYGYRFNKKRMAKLLGVKMLIILKKLKITTNKIAEVRKNFYKRITKSALDGGIHLCISVEPLWKLSKDYQLIVVSNSDGKFLRDSIKKLKLDGLFCGIHGAEEFTTKDKMLKKLFKKMGINPHEAIYIGDRFSDIKFAKKSGCFTVAIHNKCSWSSLPRIKREKPDFIIKDFRDIKKVIKELNKN